MRASELQTTWKQTMGMTNPTNKRYVDGTNNNLEEKRKNKEKTHFQVFMSFFNCLPIFFLFPIMTIFPEVSKHLTVKQYNSATCYIKKRYQQQLQFTRFPVKVDTGRRCGLCMQSLYRRYVSLLLIDITSTIRNKNI